MISYETSGDATGSEEVLANKGEGWAYAYAGSKAPYVTAETTTMPPDAKSKAHAKITVKVTADWVADPDNPNDRPSDKLWLVESSSVYASVPDRDIYSPTYRSIGIDVLTTSNPIETNSGLINGGRYKYSYGSPLPVKYDNSQRKTHLDLVTRTFVADAAASIPPADQSDYLGNPISGGASTQVGYCAYTKAVVLFRPGQHDITFDADGNIHGDTVYSEKGVWYSGDGITTTIQTVEGLNWQEFYAFHTGTWDIDHLTWAWQPAHSEATYYWNKWAMVYGGTSLLNGVEVGTPIGPVQGTMSYSATDIGQYTSGEAESKYFLTVHEPFEKKTNTGPRSQTIFFHRSACNSKSESTINLK